MAIADGEDGVCRGADYRGPAQAGGGAGCEYALKCGRTLVAFQGNDFICKDAISARSSFAPKMTSARKRIRTHDQRVSSTLRGGTVLPDVISPWRKSNL